MQARYSRQFTSQIANWKMLSQESVLSSAFRWHANNCKLRCLNKVSYARSYIQIMASSMLHRSVEWWRRKERKGEKEQAQAHDGKKIELHNFVYLILCRWISRWPDFRRRTNFPCWMTSPTSSTNTIRSFFLKQCKHLPIGQLSGRNCNRIDWKDSPWHKSSKSFGILTLSHSKWKPW